MAIIDPVRNKARVTVATGFDQFATAITLVNGEVSKLPPASEGAFNMICWNDTDYPNPIDDPTYEIMRIGGIAGNVLSPARAQEGTAAANHNLVGKTYRMAIVPTKNTIDQIRAAFPVVIQTVLSGVTSAVQVSGVSGLTSASKVIVSWGLNALTPIGALSIKEQGDDGHIIVESTAEEIVDRNIVITIIP
jgi:hypothetical protein